MTFTAKPSPAMPGAASFNAGLDAENAGSKFSAIPPAFEDVALTPFAPPVVINSDVAFYQAAGAFNPFDDAEPASVSFLEPVVPSAAVTPEAAIVATESPMKLASEPHIVSRPERKSAHPVSQWIRTIGAALESLGKRLGKTNETKSEPKPSLESVIPQPVRPDQEPAFAARGYTDEVPGAARPEAKEAAHRLLLERSRSLALSAFTVNSPRMLVIQFDNQLLILPVVLSFEIYSLTFRSRLQAWSSW